MGLTEKRQEYTDVDQNVDSNQNSNIDRNSHIDQNNTQNFQEELGTLKVSAEKSRDLNDIQRRIDSAKDFFSKKIKDMNSNTRRLSQNSASREIAGYKTIKEGAKAQLTILNSMEKRIKQIMKPSKNQPQENFDQEYTATLEDFNDKLALIESMKYEYTDYHNDLATGNTDTIPGFNITQAMGNVAGARRIYEILKKFNNKELQIANSTLDIATQKLYARDLKSLEDYLATIIYTPDFDPSRTPFDRKYEQALKYLASDITIKAMLEDKEKVKVDSTGGNKPGEYNEQVIISSTVQESFNKQTGTPETPAYKDGTEAFQKGGVEGLSSFWLDQTKMSENQKETWKGVGNLAVTGGLIFLGWKAISTAFKALSKSGRKGLNEKGGRGWLWAPFVATFGAQALTGESPLALLTGGKGTEAISKLWGGTKNEVAKTYAEGFTGVSALFEGHTCSQVAENIDVSADGKMKLKPSFYDDIISYVKGHPSDRKKAAAAKFLETIGKDDKGNLIDAALTSMGLSYAVLKDNKTDQFNEKASDAIIRLASVTQFMETNNFDRINSEHLNLLQQYIANPNSKIEDLNALQSRLGDIFENSITAPDDKTKTDFSKQIDALILSDTEKKDLKSSVNSFWSYWLVDKDLKKIEIKQSGKNISLTTYGRTTLIDLKNTTIPGLVDANNKIIRFNTIFELLKIANLTNRIFDLTKNNKNAFVKDPFNVSWIGQDIEYDNTKFWSNPVGRYDHMDKTVISGGSGSSLEKISPLLEQYKDGYTALLNTRFNSENKIQ